MPFCSLRLRLMAANKVRRRTASVAPQRLIVDASTSITPCACSSAYWPLSALDDDLKPRFFLAFLWHCSLFRYVWSSSSSLLHEGNS